MTRVAATTPPGTAAPAPAPAIVPELAETTLEVPGVAVDTGSNVGASTEVDAALISAFRAGDVSAFEQIYRLHHRYVQAQARRVISDQHRAEDITQEAFLRLVRQLLSTEGHIKLRAWLHRTATNLAIDEHRRSRTLQQYQEQRSPLEELHRTLDRNDKGHPEQEAESSEVREAIREVIATLPVRYRAILALRELEGLDYVSIAEAMNLSVSAVESLLFRARRRFTEAYQQVSSDTAPPMRRRRRRGAPPLA